MRNGRFAWPGFVLLSAACPSAAHAQASAIVDSNGEGFDTHLFRPALDSRGLLSVNGVDVLPAGKASVGLVLDYGRGLLRVPDTNQGVRPELVSHSFTGTFLFNYGIADRLVVGASAPAVLVSGDAQVRGAPPVPAVAGWSGQPLDHQSIASLALHAKLRLLPTDRGLGVAVATQIGVPVSDAPRNAGADPSFWYWPMVVLEKRIGKERELRIAVNAGYRGHAASGTTLALRDGTFRDGARITYGAGAAYRVFNPLDVVAETYGTYLLSDASAAVRPSNEALGGIKLFVDDSSFLSIGAGPRYTSGFEAADLRGMVGFVFEPPAGDRDGDGVPDDVDACPNVNGERSTVARKNGCPADDDDDGIPNVEDACPSARGVPTADPRTNGCPPPLDEDADGIPNTEDACPRIPGKRHADPKRNGCPDAYVDDTDLVVFDEIRFATASAEILPESNPILDEVAKLLRDHPEIVLVEVAGHADERGGEQYNLRLTQARVESVVAALVQRGIAPARLRAKGYGFYCPRREGHDEAAWRENRRVEFVIVKRDSGPTGAPLGCENAAAHGVRPDPLP